jgi:hypothetical protein
MVEHTRHLGNWALRIKNARKDDEGIYECQLSTHPPESIFIELRIVGELEFSASTCCFTLYLSASTTTPECRKRRQARRRESHGMKWNESLFIFGVELKLS